MIDYSETYAFLKEAAAKDKHVVKMGGRCSGKRYALEQLLNVAIAENDRLRDCIKQQEETLQEYETAMQEQTAEKLECEIWLRGYEKLHDKRFFEIRELKAALQLYCEAMQQMTTERNRIDHRAERLEKGIHRLYWAGGIDID